MIKATIGFLTLKILHLLNLEQCAPAFYVKRVRTCVFCKVFCIKIIKFIKTEHISNHKTLPHIYVSMIWYLILILKLMNATNSVRYICWCGYMDKQCNNIYKGLAVVPAVQILSSPSGIGSKYTNAVYCMCLQDPPILLTTQTFTVLLSVPPFHASTGPDFFCGNKQVRSTARKYINLCGSKAGRGIVLPGLYLQVTVVKKE